MKRELHRKIESICNEIGTSAASAACEDIVHDLESEYDKRVSVGMSELDAYRDVLKNIDEIKKKLDSLPKTDAETAEKAAKESLKNLKNILGKVSTIMWLSIVILFFYASFTSGNWHISWLIFLWGSICQNVLDMVINYNKGKPLKKVLRSGLSSILWLLTVIAYFLISFASGAWATTWLIFIFGAILQTVLGWIIGK